ncbi:hypothetical protein Tco_0172792 [Tanacetum coccineum]
MTSITAQQTKLDLEIVPKENRFDIKKCNGRIPHGFSPREPTFQVTLDALALTPCYPAFFITALKCICINSGIAFTSTMTSTDSRLTRRNVSNLHWKFSKTFFRFAQEYRVENLIPFHLKKTLGKSCEKNYSSMRRYVADPVNVFLERSITKLILKEAVIFDVISAIFRITAAITTTTAGAPRHHHHISITPLPHRLRTTHLGCLSSAATNSTTTPPHLHHIISLSSPPLRHAPPTTVASPSPLYATSRTIITTAVPPP